MRERRSPTLHDFPYRGEKRKCYHKWIINVTPPGMQHCQHSCLYCYARDAFYSRSPGEGMVVYSNLASMVARELEGLELCPPISISNVTDPCQDVPSLRQAVKELVEVLVEWGVSFHVITKGDPSFLAQVRGFPGRGRFFLAVTIEGPPEILAALSPRAPQYESRLDALRWASSLGQPALVRLDPVIPPLWRALYGDTWMEKALEVLTDCAAAGAGHVVSSTGRFSAATRDVLAGLERSISAHGETSLRGDYAYDRSYTSSGYMLRHDRRLALHRALRSAAQERGMTYAVCQELEASEADTPGLPHCEAYAMPFSRRVGEREFAPVAGCTANCHQGCAGLARPPCGRPELAASRPYKTSLLKRTRSGTRSR
ncbi:MAG: radical SAM protein [Actinobacteria bacterium]|nr:radical SAM protein [Actinomycetota bacterium]